MFANHFSCRMVDPHQDRYNNCFAECIYDIVFINSNIKSAFSYWYSCVGNYNTSHRHNIGRDLAN